MSLNSVSGLAIGRDVAVGELGAAQPISAKARSLFFFPSTEVEISAAKVKSQP